MILSENRFTFFGIMLYRASGSGRTWNFATFGRVPLPVSVWNGLRVP